jgi:hypothetical protein
MHDPVGRCVMAVPLGAFEGSDGDAVCLGIGQAIFMTGPTSSSRECKGSGRLAVMDVADALPPTGADAAAALLRED